MSAKPVNPNDPIYLQYLVDNPTDISKYPQYAEFAAKKPPYNLCFSNAGVNNPWRVTGYVTMREQVEAAPRRKASSRTSITSMPLVTMPNRSQTSRTSSTPPGNATSSLLPPTPQKP